MNDGLLRKITQEGVRKAVAAGMPKARLAEIAKWKEMALWRFLQNENSNKIENVRIHYRFLLSHRFIENSTADLAHEVYAMGDTLASDAPFEKKFFCVREFVEKYGAKVAVLNSLKEKAGKSKVE